MEGDRQRRRQALYRLAAGQAGFFTAAQALDLGYSYQAQKHHIDHGNWARVDRGIFRIPEWPPSLNDSFVRWVLWSKHRAVVSHDSAAVVHNLGLLNPAKVHLTVPQGFRMDDPVLALHRRQLPDADVMLLDGVVVTTVVRTVLDVIDSQFDEELVASVVDDALDKGAISERQLRRRLEELDSAERVRAERVLARKSRNVPVSAEPAALRLIGYWRSEFDENRWPDQRTSSTQRGVRPSATWLPITFSADGR